MGIKENIETVKANIKKYSKNPDYVTLIAVTKTVDYERMMESYDAGIRDFGENKVQEILNKKTMFPSDVRWHLIGTLQTNKVKQILDKVVLIHSLDSEHLASEINKRAESLVSCLIQINISSEESKHGIKAEDALKFAENIDKNFPNIKISGFMGMAPFVENEIDSKPYFVKMREIFDEARLMRFERAEIKYLSMGMTNDYKTALSAGSNMVRIGTAIFGNRNYN